VSTRWNSTFYMLERTIETRQSITATISDNKTKCNVQVDFEFVEQLVEILRPIEQFTKLLSSRNASISSVLPTYYALKQHLSADSDETELLKKFKETVLSGLVKRMKDFEQNPQVLIKHILFNLHCLGRFLLQQFWIRDLKTLCLTMQHRLWHVLS